jgi:hypothetical protein
MRHFLGFRQSVYQALVDGAIAFSYVLCRLQSPEWQKPCGR